MGEREVLLARLWETVPAPARPVLIAVDGADGAGKTTFADALADAAPVQRAVVRVGIDDFHRPRADRHAAGRTGETVWGRSFDYEALRRELLDPWRRGAGTAYRPRWHDLASDAGVEERPGTVPDQGVLLVDGVFAQRRELADAWDLVVYLDATDGERIARMARRDGVPADPDHPDQRRYLDAQRIYQARCRPRERADLVIDNEDPRRPRIVASTAR